MKHVVELQAAVPQELVSDFLGKLHYISEDMASIALDGTNVRFDTKPGRDESANVIAGRIKEVATKMSLGHGGMKTRVLSTRRPAQYRFGENPRARLDASGELFEFGRGRFGLGPTLVRLEEYFEKGLLGMADRLDAPPYRFPALIGVDVLQRCRYIQSFPQHLSLVTHLREDLGAIQQFARDSRVADGKLTYPPESTAAPECLLASAVCFHYYAWLHDRKLERPSAITAVGHCFRYESGSMATLERLWDFTMREIIFVGPRDYVLGQRERGIELTKELLDEWELGYEIRTATDPFFIEGYASQVAFQSAFELKFEIRADLPYAPGSSLAVGSFNFHQDFFGRSLGISAPGDAPAFTGCVAFGIERLVWAFLAQHGPDPAGWPQAARSAVRQASTVSA